MMREVVKSENVNETYYYVLNCGHRLVNLRGFHVIEDFKKSLWCDVCYADQLNKDLTNIKALGGITNEAQYNPPYKDPLWHEGKEPTPTLDSFQKLLHDVQKIHDKKKHDYSQPGDRWSNFTESGIIGSMFKNPTDNAFAVLIGVKLARLSNLLGNKLVPNNESIDDTFLDLTTYCALWAAYHKDNK